MKTEITGEKPNHRPALDAAMTHCLQLEAFWRRTSEAKRYAS